MVDTCHWSTFVIIQRKHLDIMKEISILCWLNIKSALVIFLSVLENSRTIWKQQLLTNDWCFCIIENKMQENNCQGKCY